MLYSRLAVLALAVMLLGVGRAAAQDPGLDVEDVDNVRDQWIRANFLTVDCPLHSMQPKLTNLKRSWRTDTEDLIGRFLGDRETIMKEERIESPTWGRGTRYKSGTVLYLYDKEMAVPQEIGQLAKEIEVVPSFLDVFNNGFTYINNIPHTAVYATDVKITSETSADVSYHNVYEAAEGQASAEKLISDMFGPLSVPAGFQPAVQTLIQDFGERLFVYHARPEYITEYNVYEYELVADDPNNPRRHVIGTQPVSVPVWDVKVHLMLDGEKLLAGMEYYWDGNLQAVGEPKECIQAGIAVVTARELLYEYFNEEPPLLTVKNLSLGFIQDRSDPNTLIPVWLFDAWYTETVTMDAENLTDAPPLTSPYARNVVSVPLPFAINALTKELIVL
ncbi:hypothetical protein JW859_08330 [bacterium]|nr:hypothetical protein [bacterium]